MKYNYFYKSNREYENTKYQFQRDFYCISPSIFKGHNGSETGKTNNESMKRNVKKYENIQSTVRYRGHLCG